jgi:hypothetical protein
MKLQDRIFFKQILKPAVVHIAKLADETFSSSTGTGHKKIFSSADMWNIQRRRKSLLLR